MYGTNTLYKIAINNSLIKLNLPQVYHEWTNVE